MAEAKKAKNTTPTKAKAMSAPLVLTVSVEFQKTLGDGDMYLSDDTFDVYGFSSKITSVNLETLTPTLNKENTNGGNN